MELWLPIIFVSILITLIFIIYLKHSSKKSKPKQLRIQSTLRMYVPPINKLQIQESLKKKKKKKHKKIKQSDPILEIPQQEQSQEEPVENGNIKKVQSELLAQVNDNNKVEQQDVIDCSELILTELEMIRGYFMNDLRQIIPYSKSSMGSYQIELTDNYGSSCKCSIMFVWKYNKKYPLGGLDIEMKEAAYLTRLDADLFKGEVERLKKGNQLGDNPLFDMLTRTFSRIIELGRPMQQENQQKQPLFQQMKVLNKITSLTNQDSKKQEQSYDHHENNKKREQRQEEEQKQAKKPQLQTLVNQMFFYPHDLIQAPQWGDSQQVEPIKPSKLSTEMRYKKQFLQIKKIGEGGFGRVYLAKNKFDQNIYAVKKCLLNETNPSYKKTIKQVTLLSQLNHPNIVRYHQSWTEEVNSIQELINQLEVEEQQQQELEEQFKKWKHDRIEIQFADSQRNQDTDSLEDQLDRLQDLSVSSQGIVFANFPNDSVASIAKEKERKKSNQQSDSESSLGQKSHFPFKILYIAMQYCGQHTLKDWIDRIKTKDKKKLQEERTYLFREILEALVYIHDRKIIHRDLKPPNIFWDEKNNRIKLGDFGVATNINEDKFHILKKDVSQDRIDISDKTKGVGTPIYRAPEQLKSGRYNEKVDIFSLGIILFEMNFPFSTRMQRQQALLQLKNAKFPPDFKNIDGRKLIKSLISENPADRPSARSLLMSVRNNYFGQIVSTITNPKHFEFRQLMSCIFKIQNHSTKTFQYQAFNHLDYKDLESIFKCHGGSNLHLSPIIPVQDFTFTNGVKVKKKREGKFLIISHQGVVLELCNNSYQPWIAWLLDTLSRNPQKKVPCIRRYSFAETVHQNEGLFTEKRTGVFDLIYPVSYTSLPLQYQCEIIRMSTETNTSFQDVPVILGHSQLISLFCEENYVSQEFLYGILHSDNFKKYDEMSYEKKLEQLKKYDFEQALCHKILTMLDIKASSLAQFQKQLQQSLTKSNYEGILSHFHDLIELLIIMNIHNFQFVVGIPPQHCRGIFWSTDRVRGFASIQNFQKQEIGTLHVQIDLKHIHRSMPDVYVWSVGEYLQKQIIQIVVKCWDAGLHTEWSKSPKGQKVENVKIGVTLKRGQKKVLVLIKNYETAKDIVDWIPKQSFSVDLIFNLIKNQSNRLALMTKDSKSKES